MELQALLPLLTLVGIFVLAIIIRMALKDAGVVDEVFPEETPESREAHIQACSDQFRAATALGGDHVGPAQIGDWDSEFGHTRPVRPGCNSIHNL